MLQISQLDKTYKNGIKALNKINLTVGKGVFGLLGPNGAGKSTLMRTIATLQDPDSGTIFFDGIDVLHQKEQMRSVLGYLPQEFGVYPSLSAERMLDYLALLKGIVNTKERKRTVEHLLEMTNLLQHRKKNLGSFSGGMKQRFGIAQALLGNPKIIIVDEATAGLDPVERDRFHNLLSFIGEDRIIILSTHIVSDVADLCNDLAIIQDGQVILNQSPVEALGILRGKIWTTTISRVEIPRFSEKFKIVSSCLKHGKTKVRIWSEDRPGSDFDPAEPDLEDVYFSLIKKIIEV